MSEQLESDFTCPKCHGRGGVSRLVVLADRMILPLGSAHYKAVSCRLCGYTEFYCSEAPADIETAREGQTGGVPEQGRPA